MSRSQAWLKWAALGVSPQLLTQWLALLTGKTAAQDIAKGESQLASATPEALDEIYQCLLKQPQLLPRSKKFLPLLHAVKHSEFASKLEQAAHWQTQAKHHHLLTLDDPTYPPMLKLIADPPLVLFVKGQLSPLLQPCLAIVGSRQASRSGCQIAQDFAEMLTQQGLCVASGMAAGIDRYAHLGALKNVGAFTQGQAATIAVLGTGVEQCYPNNHQQLKQQIIEQGCVISEFWPQTKPYRGNFPKRNRLLSGLSLGTLVVEAALKSGSLITARLAAEQGREVFAIPGGILSGYHQGCHQLLKKGAKLVENVEDITEELTSLYQSQYQILSQYQQTHTENANPTEAQPLLSYINDQVTSIDEMLVHSGQSIDAVLTQLLDLELAGWIATVPGGYVRLKRS